MTTALRPLASPRLVTERFTDAQVKAWRGRHVDLGDRYEANALAELLALRKAVEWFADPANWHEEQLSEGSHFSAEWKVGFDPREIARRALGRAA